MKPNKYWKGLYIDCKYFNPLYILKVLISILTLFRAWGGIFISRLKHYIWIIVVHPLFLNICWECESMKKIVCDMDSACTGVVIIHEKLKKSTKIAYFELNLPVRHDFSNIQCTSTKSDEYWAGISFQS